MDSNFQCIDCESFFFVSFFRITYNVDGSKSHKDKKGNIIKCDKCESENTIPLKKEGYGVPMFGKFKSMTSQQKKSMLQKRSKDNFKGEIKEKADHIRKNFNGYNIDKIL